LTLNNVEPFVTAYGMSCNSLIYETPIYGTRKNLSVYAYTTRGATKYKPITKKRGIAEVTPFSTFERSTTRIRSVVNNIFPHFKPRIK